MFISASRYYSVTLERNICQNCDRECGDWKNEIIKTENFQLARQVFVFHLIGKNTKQKMTPFQFRKVKEALQEGQYTSKKGCNCGQCLKTLHLNLNQEVMQTSYDFTQQCYPQIANQYDKLHQNGEIEYDEPTIDFYGQNTQELINQFKTMDIQ